MLALLPGARGSPAPLAAIERADTNAVGDTSSDSDGDTSDIIEVLPGDTSDTSDTSPGGLGDPGRVCQAALTCAEAIADDPKRPCAFTVVSGDGAPVYDGMALVEKRGRSSVAFPKSPYAVALHADGAELVPPGATWRYLAGFATPPADWTAVAFFVDKPAVCARGGGRSWMRGPPPLRSSPASRRGGARCPT